MVGFARYVCGERLTPCWLARLKATFKEGTELFVHGLGDGCVTPIASECKCAHVGDRQGQDGHIATGYLEDDEDRGNWCATVPLQAISGFSGSGVSQVA